MAMTLAQFREHYENEHDFMCTIPDERYQDQVIPHFMELVEEAELAEHYDEAMGILEAAFFRSRYPELRTSKQFMERLGGQYWRLDLHAFAKLLKADPNNPVTQDQFRAFGGGEGSGEV